MVLCHTHSNSHKDGRWPPLIILRRDSHQRPDVLLSNWESLKTLDHLVVHGGYREFIGALGFVDHCEIELNIIQSAQLINGERVARS